MDVDERPLHFSSRMSERATSDHAVIEELRGHVASADMADKVTEIRPWEDRAMDFGFIPTQFGEVYLDGDCHINWESVDRIGRWDWRKGGHGWALARLLMQARADGANPPTAAPKRKF